MRGAERRVASGELTRILASSEKSGGSHCSDSRCSDNRYSDKHRPTARYTYGFQSSRL